MDWLEYFRDGGIKHDPALLQEATYFSLCTLHVRESLDRCHHLGAPLLDVGDRSLVPDRFSCLGFRRRRFGHRVLEQLPAHIERKVISLPRLIHRGERLREFAQLGTDTAEIERSLTLTEIHLESLLKLRLG